MTCTIRNATAADVGELARLRWEFRVDEHAGQAQSDFLNDCGEWITEALTTGRWVVAVAELKDGSLCGCMYMQCVDKVPVPGGIRRAWGYVTNSYVASEARGTGIGRKLLDLLVHAGRALRLEFLIVWPSEQAVSFYERAGFHAVSSVHAGPGDEPPLEMVLPVPRAGVT